MSTSPPFRARLRQMRNKRYEDWWHIVFGGPVGTLIAAVISEVRWITPNRLTLAAFFCRLAAAILILAGNYTWDVAAAILLQLNIALDIADGSLARYRAVSSATGAFLDKVSDGLGLAVLGGCLGWRAFSDGQPPMALVAGMFIGASYLLRCYMYWVVAFLELKSAPPVSTIASAPPEQLLPRLRYYLQSSWRVVMVGEGDVCFWVALFALLGHLQHLVLPLAGAMAIWLVLLTGKRLTAVASLDRSGQSR